MKYIVYTVLSKIDTTILTNSLDTIEAAKRLIQGKHIDLPTDKIKAELGIIEYKRKEFTSGAPIECRRTAIDYAQNFATVVNESRQYISPMDYSQAVTLRGREATHKLFNYQIPLFNAWINAEIDGEEKTIAGIVSAEIETIHNWIGEYNHYVSNGFDIGDSKPFTAYFMPLDKYITLLPDITPLWSVIELNSN